MTHQLKTLDTFSEGSIPSTCMAAHNLLQFQFQGIQLSLLASTGAMHACGIQTDI